MGASAYLLWGVFPLYFAVLAPAGAVEILVHRVFWSALTCALLLSVARGWRLLRVAVADRSTLATLAVASLLVSANWLIYIHAVISDHVVEAALGYYINPLVTVLLGVLVLGERLRPAQWVACGLALVAVGVLSVGYGRPPWIAFALAVTFAFYSLAKNRVGRTVGAITSLTVETGLLTPVAVAAIGFLVWTGQSTFGGHGTGHALLMAVSGVVTSIPLLLFAGAASRIPLSLVGVLQYLTPTLQFAIGVLVMREPMTSARWLGFVLVWLALIVFTADVLRKRSG